MRLADVKFGEEYAARTSGHRYAQTVRFVPVGVTEVRAKTTYAKVTALEGEFISETGGRTAAFVLPRLVVSTWAEYVEKNEAARRNREASEAERAARLAERERRTAALRESGDLDRALALLGVDVTRQGEYSASARAARDLATAGSLNVYVGFDVLERLAALTEARS